MGNKKNTNTLDTAQVIKVAPMQHSLLSTIDELKNKVEKNFSAKKSKKSEKRLKDISKNLSALKYDINQLLITRNSNKLRIVKYKAQPGFKREDKAFKDGELFLFLGELDTFHCAVVDMKGKVHWMYHTKEFEYIPEEAL